MIKHSDLFYHDNHCLGIDKQNTSTMLTESWRTNDKFVMQMTIMSWVLLSSS